jgi:hypothetical protein
MVLLVEDREDILLVLVRILTSIAETSLAELKISEERV